MEGAGERCLKQNCGCLEPVGSSRRGKGLQWESCSIRGAATMGTNPEHPPQWEQRGERGVRGEATGIITRAGLIAINIRNQINMSRCVFHFSHICGT